MQRMMYVWLPHLNIERLVRQTPELKEAFFALTQKIGNRVVVTGVSAKARAKGFVAGGSLSDLRVVDPSLRQFEAEPDKDLDMVRVLVRWASRYTPLVARDAADGFYLNVTGATHLFGGEEALVEDIKMRLGKMGFDAQIGLAPTASMAWSVAHFSPEHPIVCDDQLMDRARILPLQALQLDEAQTQLARSLGLKNLNDMLRLPRGGVASRFSLSVLKRLDQITNQAPESLDYATHTKRYDVARAFIEPIGHIDDVERGIDLLLDQLCARLKARGKGVLLLRLMIERVDHQALHFEVRTLQPTIRASDLKRLFAHHFDNLDVGFGIEKIHLSAHKTAPLDATQSVMSASATLDAEQDGCADLINQLANRYGPETVMRYQPQDTHIPERSAQPVPALYAHQHHEKWGYSPLKRPVKLFQKPQPVLLRALQPDDVGVASPEPHIAQPHLTFIQAEISPNDQPLSRSYHREQSNTETDVPAYIYMHGKSEPIFLLSGPERIEPLWFFDDADWRTGARDYFWVLSAKGALLWIYRTIQPHQIQWFIHGVGS